MRTGLPASLTRRLPVLLAAALLAVSGGCGSGGRSSAGAASRVVTASDVSVVLPPGYVNNTAHAVPNAVSGRAPELEITGPPTGHGRPIFRVARLTQSVPLAELIPAAQSAVRRRVRATIDRDGTRPLAVAGDPGKTFGYTFNELGLPLRARQVYVTHAGAVYVLTFTAPAAQYGADLVGFDEAVASLRWR